MNLPPSTIHTPGFAHYSVSWSPFFNNRLAVASSANYGLVGNGRLHLVSLGSPSPGTSAPSPILDKSYATQDGLFDVAWSETHENQLVTASGDGSLRLWDVTLNDLPVRVWQEHSREVYSVDWSNMHKDVFASSSWDGTIKVWNPDRPHSVHTLQAHAGCVYQALFSPHHPELVASCASDGLLKIFDLRSPAYPSSSHPSTFAAQPAAATPALTIPASANGGELLTLDWNKYQQFVIAASGTDKHIRVWDCRMMKLGGSGSEGPAVGGSCMGELLGHEYAVRKVQWSPHRSDVLASASYDMTCRIWTTNPAAGETQLVRIYDAHTEFVAGCGWSIFEEGLIASCGWDSRLSLFRVL